jgi:hypothetical protein
MAEQLCGERLARAQIMALYALQIQAGERPGPYDDRDADRYARRVLRRRTRRPSATGRRRG